MESSTSDTTYSYRRYVCLDCRHKNLLNPANPLVCPDCQSTNIRDSDHVPAEPVLALEGFYSMKPYYCHQCHKKNLLSTGGPFVCPECGSQTVELITEQLKREDPHFQAILGHPIQKEEPPVPPPQDRFVSPFNPFSMFHMGSPFDEFEMLFRGFTQPRDLFREGFNRRGTPFSSRQSHLLDHFFNQVPGFDSIPSMQQFFGPQSGVIPGMMSFADLLSHISQQHPDSHNPTNPEVVQRLEVLTVSEEMVRNGDACTVCQETLKAGEQAKVLPCKHLFHPGCIDPWLSVKNTCPVCRQQIDA